MSQPSPYLKNPPTNPQLTLTPSSQLHPTSPPHTYTHTHNATQPENLPRPPLQPNLLRSILLPRNDVPQLPNTSLGGLSRGTGEWGDDSGGDGGTATTGGVGGCASGGVGEGVSGGEGRETLELVHNEYLTPSVLAISVEAPLSGGEKASVYSHLGLE